MPEHFQLRLFYCHSFLLQAIELDSCKLLNIKVGRVGGLFQATRLNTLAQKANIPAWIGGMFETPLGFMANAALGSGKNFSYPIDFFGGPTYIKDFERLFATLPYQVKQDTLHLSFTQTSLGDVLDWELLQQYIVQEIELR